LVISGVGANLVFAFYDCIFFFVLLLEQKTNKSMDVHYFCSAKGEHEVRPYGTSVKQDWSQ